MAVTPHEDARSRPFRTIPDASPVVTDAEALAEALFGPVPSPSDVVAGYRDLMKVVGALVASGRARLSA